MNQLTIFKSEVFGQVRTVEVNGKIMLVGIDVAKALGYKDPNSAISRHCKGWVKHPVVANGGFGEQTVMMNVISEGDVYRLTAKSELPGAEKFESWIFDEVIPSIRKHGAYMTPETIEKVLLDPDTIIQLATNLKEEQQKRIAAETKLTEAQPKIIFADAVSASSSTILIGELAKLLKQNGVDIGGTRLFKWLRDNGYLIKRNGTDYNTPTQKSMELGLFTVKETSITHSDGHISINKTTKVTGKGQSYFINKFLQESA